MFISCYYYYTILQCYILLFLAQRKFISRPSLISLRRHSGTVNLYRNSFGFSNAKYGCYGNNNKTIQHWLNDFMPLKSIYKKIFHCVAFLIFLSHASSDFCFRSVLCFSCCHVCTTTFPLQIQFMEENYRAFIANYAVNYYYGCKMAPDSTAVIIRRYLSEPPSKENLKISLTKNSIRKYVIIWI